MSRLWVNRRRELRSFDEMLQGSVKGQRILLIEAESQMGKSELLREFAKRCPSHARQLILDFRYSLGLTGVIHQIHSGLDVPVDREVILSALDKEVLKYGLLELTNKLFCHLRQLQDLVVFFFDSLDHATPEVHDWLMNTALVEISRSNNIIAVVASKPLNHLNSTWSAYCKREPPLAGITQIKEWYSEAKVFYQGLPFF